MTQRNRSRIDFNRGKSVSPFGSRYGRPSRFGAPNIPFFASSSYVLPSQALTPPNQIEGMVEWWKTDNENNFLLTGSNNIQQWTGSFAGYVLTASSLAMSPFRSGAASYFNGAKPVRFDADNMRTDGEMIFSVNSTSSGLSYFIIMVNRENNGNVWFSQQAARSDTAFVSGARFLQNSNAYSIGISTNVNNSRLHTASLNTAEVIVGTWDKTENVARIFVSLTGAFANGTSGSALTKFSGTIPFYIGDPDTTFAVQRFEIVEMGLFNRKLTSAQVIQISQYAFSTYGVVQRGPGVIDL